MTKPTRIYANDEITVEWYPERCIHCQECVRGLPTVFNIDARPWVNINGASANEIRQQVLACPSKALNLGN